MAAVSAVAQDGALAGVTMRVVDDLSGLDAAILELEPAADDGRDAAADAAADADAAAERDAAANDDGDVERPAPPLVP
jgi:hypothetical protein